MENQITGIPAHVKIHDQKIIDTFQTIIDEHENSTGEIDSTLAIVSAQNDKVYYFDFNKNAFIRDED